jgi:hypothetical protein
MLQFLDEVDAKKETGRVDGFPYALGIGSMV